MVTHTDPNSTVRRIFSRFQKNAPDLVEVHCQLLLPHGDDNTVLPLCSWSEDLVDNKTMTVSVKHVSDMHIDLNSSSSMPHEGVLLNNAASP